MADEVDVLERLRPGDLGFEQQRLAVRRLLRLEIELVGARGGNGRELLLERCRHVVYILMILNAYEGMRGVPKAIGRSRTAWIIVVAGSWSAVAKLQNFSTISRRSIMAKTSPCTDKKHFTVHHPCHLRSSTSSLDTCFNTIYRRPLFCASLLRVCNFAI